MIQRKLRSDCSLRLKVKVCGIFGAMPIICSRLRSQLMLAETKSNPCWSWVSALSWMKVELRHHDEARGVDLDALIRASSFFDRSRNCQGIALVFRRIELEQRLVIRIVVGLAPISLLRLRERREMDVRGRDLLAS